MGKLYIGKNSEYLKRNPDWHSELSWWKAEKIEKMIGRNSAGNDYRYQQEIIDFFYTDGMIEVYNHGLKSRFWNKVRQGISIFNKEFAVRLLGGYSLMVLAK